MAQTFAAFLKTYSPSVVYPVWASQAIETSIAAPDEEKIVSGWTIEKPKHNYFNWHMNRTDNRLDDAEAKIEWIVSELKSAGLLK